MLIRALAPTKPPVIKKWENDDDEIVLFSFDVALICSIVELIYFKSLLDGLYKNKKSELILEVKSRRLDCRQHAAEEEHTSEKWRDLCPWDITLIVKLNKICLKWLYPS